MPDGSTPKYLGALKPDFLANLKKAAQRQEDVKALIARKEVAINMTPEEVTASLGKAGKTTSRLDATGQHEVWEYVKYEEIPAAGEQRLRPPGQYRLVHHLRQSPLGENIHHFENNVVTAIEQSEGNLAKDSQVKILATPIDVY